MRKAAIFAAIVVLAYGQVAYAASSCASGNVTVLQGIPAIAKVFAPLVGANWQNFAQDLAGICAVESKCSPTYPHYLQNGVYSQYQGLYQMNMYEVAKAENYLNQVYPQLQQLAQSGQIPPDAWSFFQQAVQSGRSSSGDRRFLPAYGVILGAAKHIQIQKQLENQYPGDPLRQAAGHMVAQFSGITESKIAAGNFNAAVTGTIGNANTELGALGANRVSGSTVAGAIESAGATYGSCMQAMMTQMSQVTGGLTSVPTVVAPFNAPAYKAGSGPVLSVPYSGVSTLMEMGAIPPSVAPSIAPTTGSSFPSLSTAAPQYVQQPAQTQTTPTTQPSNTTSPVVSPSASTSSSLCSPQYYCTNNTVYYRSDSCSTTVFQQCRYGCSGTICTPSPNAATSSLNVPTQPLVANSSGYGILGTTGAIGTATGIAATSSLSSSLDTSVVSIGTAGNPWQNASSSIQSSTTSDEQYSGGTFAETYQEETYAAPVSPFFQVLDQLRLVLNGFLSYLGSL